MWLGELDKHTEEGDESLSKYNIDAVGTAVTYSTFVANVTYLFSVVRKMLLERRIESKCVMPNRRIRTFSMRMLAPVRLLTTCRLLTYPTSFYISP